MSETQGMNYKGETKRMKREVIVFGRTVEEAVNLVDRRFKK